MTPPNVSPLPWKEVRAHNGVVVVHDLNGENVADARGDVRKANAAFIVRAVNNHERLVEALDGLAWVLDKAESDASGTERWEFVSRRINAARAALAAAKEEA